MTPKTMTGAGLIVVGTAATVTLMLYATVCIIYIRGGEFSSELASAASGALLATIGMLARTRPDPAASIDPPAHIEVTSSEPAPLGDTEVR